MERRTGPPLSPGVAFRLISDGDLAIVELTGGASLDDFVHAIDALAGYTRAHRQDRALANLLGAERQLPFTDHYAIGQKVAQELRHLKKVASVVPEPFVTRTSERVAQTAGVQLRVFTTEDAAREWLALP